MEIQLMQGDCLELMQGIPDGSVDMILCDLPYGVTRNKWDSVIPLVLRFNRERGWHPTQKPVPLLEYLIRTYTNEGETVLDNCMGSGSTGVACINTGRNFIGIELDAGYFETAKKRIESAQIGKTRKADFIQCSPPKNRGQRKGERTWR